MRTLKIDLTEASPDLIHQFRNFGEDVYQALGDTCEVSIEEIDASTHEFYVRGIHKSELRTIQAKVREIAEKNLMSKINFDDFLQRASHSRKQSGDFASFFVRQVSHYGGHTQFPSHLPELKGTWYFESDHDGFAAQLYNFSFTEVQSFMQKVYGGPISAVDPHGLYGAAQIGVAIQFKRQHQRGWFYLFEEADKMRASPTNPIRPPPPCS